MSNILEIIEKIEKNRVETGKDIAAIRKDITLSPEGKRMKITKVFSSGKLEHKRLIQEYKLAQEDRKKDLVRGVYKHPSAYGSNSEEHISEMRAMVEKAEAAYKSGELEALIERAIGMRDKILIRAVGSVAYAKKDYRTMEKLETIDGAVREALDYERGFGELASPQLKVELNMLMRGVEEPLEVSQSDRNALM